MEKIDLVIQLQEQQHESILRVHDKIDNLSEKVGSESIAMQGRVTKLETVTSLKNRILYAVAALLPAIGVAAYFFMSQ